MTRLLPAVLMTALFSFAVHGTTLEEMESEIKKNPNRLSTRIQLANVYLKQKNFERVIALLNSYTDQLPSQGFLALATAYSKRDDYANEVRVLGLLADKEDSDFHWRLLLGQALLKQASAQTDLERKEKSGISAIQQLRKAIQLEPNYKPAYDLLLNTLLQMKANNESRELLYEGINKFGDRPELYRELCRLDANDGFLDQAVNNCRRGIKLAPNYPDNYVFLVQALTDQQEDQLAETDIVSAARKFQKSEFVQWAAGTLYLRKKNYPVAARYFQTAVKANPKAGRSQFGLAQSLFESGDEKGSLEHFIKSCELEANSIDTFLSAGGKLKQKGNMELGNKFISSANTCKRKQ